MGSKSTLVTQCIMVLWDNGRGLPLWILHSTKYRETVTLKGAFSHSVRKVLHDILFAGSLRTILINQAACLQYLTVLSGHQIL